MRLSVLRRGKQQFHFALRHPVIIGAALDTAKRWMDEGGIMTPSMKLAQLLLSLCAAGQQTEFGIQINLSFSLDEIGLIIGVSNETVSLCVVDLINLNLAKFHDSSFLIPNVHALEIYVAQTGCKKKVRVAIKA